MASSARQYFGVRVFGVRGFLSANVALVSSPLRQVAHSATLTGGLPRLKRRGVTEQDTAANHTFAGLTAGVNYTIDVNAAGTAGQSDWSNPASLTAD